MARLRFPGRPGCRFDRMGVRYGADEAKNVNDPTLVLVASIHRGLRLFRELFGESDEEEEFEGFTQKDVQKSERKLKAMLAQSEDSSEKVPSGKPVGKRLAKIKDTLTAADRGRGVRKSYTELLKHGIVKPAKTSLMKQAREETKKSLKIKLNVKKEKSALVSSSFPAVTRKSLDKKSVKFDLTPKGQGKRKSVEVDVKKTIGVSVKQKKGNKCPEKTDEETPQYTKKKVKERDKLSPGQGLKGVKGQQNLVKQLLQKARKGQQAVKVQGKMKSPVTSPKSPRGPSHPKKQFVLPTQSSRSSRVIIPNKRFLEQDDFNQIMTKRSRVEESTLSPRTETFSTSTTTTTTSTSPRVKIPDKSKVKAEQLTSPQLTSLSQGPAVPPLPPGHLFDPVEAGQTLSLYDQPLIVEGKRARKPSLKVRIKLTDERIQAFQVKSFEKKLQARKNIEAEKAAVGSMAGSKKVHLTPSKLAVTVTSPSKLPTSPIFAPPKFGVSGKSALSERQRLEALEKEALATRRKGHNILRKAKLQLSRSALNRSKADFARTLKKEIKMEAKLEKMRLKQGSAIGGFSKLSGYSTFAGVAKSYMDAKDEQPGPEGHETESGMLDTSQEGVVCAVCKDSNLPPVRRRNYYGVPCCDGCRRFYRVHMKRVKEKEFFCNGNCSTDIRRCVFCRYLRCQEVFPAEDKLKPLKESPTKKVVPEDSMEDTEGLMSPPRTIPVTVQTPGESEEGTSTAVGPITSSPESVASSPASEGRGPRIKHVCRKAAVVLGKPVAKFPQTPPQSSLEITLSALPRGEKVKLWKKEEETKAGLSDDERPLDEIIQQSEDNVCTVKRSPHKSPALGRLIPGSRGRLTVRRRKLRCKKCPGCLAKDCGKCIYCQDKPKFGGRGVMKQACVDRKCSFPRYSRAATAAFIKPKDPPPEGESCDQGCDTSMEISEPSDPSQNSTGCSNINPNNKNGNGTSSSMNLIRRMVLQSQGNARPEAGVKHAGESEAGIRTPANISRQLLPHFSGGLSRENLSQKSGRQSPLVPPYRSGDPQKKPGLGVLSPKKMPKGKDRNLTVLRSEHCVLQPLASTLRHWPALGAHGNYRIKAEFKENYDIDKAWLSGVPLTMSGPLCVRTICYLCGSAGKFDFVFCNVCCEPFHEFCLDEDERPTEDNRENWCCHRCQFCHVCGEQYNLLRCDKCQNTYHPECLGPNYPTKPSKKKKIWVCTKCVRCKSCGSTTPGNAGHATWTYDFQLCYECGKLMDKGNFCPMCHKCYSDDDWESKMVQCVTCESWVHAKCEGLNDEMYERVSFLPEDVHYICKMCSPGDRPRHWELVLRDDLQAGIKSVFYTLLNAKCAQHLLHRDVKKESIQINEMSKQDEAILVEGVKDCERTANEGSKKLEDRKSEGGSSSNTTAEKEDPERCNTEAVSVTMETNTEVTSLSDSKCDSNTSDPMMGKETGLREGQDGDGEHVGQGNEADCDGAGVGLGNKADCDGARVGQGDEADCDIKSGECSILEKPVPCSVGESGENKGSDIPMEIDELCEADVKASDNESMGGSNINRTAVVNDSQVLYETNTKYSKNDLMGGSVIDRTPLKESEGGSSDERIAAHTKLMTDKQNLITDLKDEVDGDQTKGQIGDLEQVLDRSQSIKHLEPCLSLEKSEGQSEFEKSKSIVQSEIITITDNNQTDSSLHSIDKSDSVIQDCKVGSDQSDLSLHLKTAQSDNISKVDVKTEESKSEMTPNIDNNNSLDLKCETSQNENTKCEASEKEEKVCEVSQKEETKCEIPQQEGKKCETKDTKCESSDVKSKNCERKQEDLKCESTKSNELCERRCETPQKLSPMTDIALLTPKKSGSLTSVHVRFSEKGGLFRKVAPSRDFPHDFSAVKTKMASDKYNNVEEFSEDMAHIISQAINDPLDQRIVRKKNNNSVRSIFVKQMERCFPWFNIKTCKLWDQQQSLPGGMLPEAVIPPSEDHTYAQWLERQETPKSPQPSPFKKLHSTPIPKVLPIAVDEDAEKVLSCDLEDAGEDMRRCILCWHYGDADPNDAGRLLYSGQDDWIHINCALWSAEAYEEEHDGSLQFVHAAVSRGKLLKCDHCNRSGATVGCCMRGCPANYHFMCARQSHCVFQEDKKVFCSLHRDKVDGELVAKDRFAVNRRVLVNMEGVKWAKKTWAKGLDPAVINVLIGSCTVESLGRLTPSSDYRDCLAPADFCSSRVFWSTRDARRRCVYTCRIVEVKPDSPKSMKVVLKDMTIIHDENHPDFVPLSTLDIPGVNLFPVTESLDNKNNNSLKSDIIDLSGESCEIDGSVVYQSSSIQGQDSESDKLSSSWPLVKKKTSKVDLSLLSPKTLKLLNIKDPEKYKKAAVPEKAVVKQAPPNVINENNFSGFLTKIADRLNQAAARNIGRKDGEKTPPHGGLRGRARSNSVERMPSRSNSVERFVPSPLPHVRSKSVERFVTSPLPISRSSSRSNSVERDYLVSSPGVLPQNDTEVLDDTGSYHTKDSESDGNATISTVSAEESMNQSGMAIDSSLEPIAEEGDVNTENVQETVIVLPDDCGELTEEEVLAIAQAALQQQEGEETLQLQGEETCEEKNNSSQDNPEGNESLKENSFMTDAGTSEALQLIEEKKGLETNADDIIGTLSDPSGQVTTSDFGGATETGMEHSTVVTDYSYEQREKTPELQREISTEQKVVDDLKQTIVSNCSGEMESAVDHSNDGKVTISEDPKKVCVDQSGEIKENVADPQGYIAASDQDCDVMDSGTETNIPMHVTGSKIKDHGKITPLDLTNDSLEEMEAGVDDVILVDINTGKREAQEAIKSNLELDVKWTDDMYLCSTSGRFIPKSSSGSDCKDIKKSVSEKHSGKSVSKKDTNEMVHGEVLTESVSDKCLTEDQPATRMTESVSDKGLIEEPKVGPTKKQDGRHKGGKKKNRYQSTQDVKPGEDQKLIDKLRRDHDRVEDIEMTDTITGSDQTNKDKDNKVTSVSPSQDTGKGDGLNGCFMEGAKIKESKHGSVKENHDNSKDVEITAIDLTGDDVDDDGVEMTNKLDAVSGSDNTRVVDNSNFSTENHSSKADKAEDDSQKIVRREPLRFLRPIEEKPVEQKKYQKKSKQKSKQSKKTKVTSKCQGEMEKSRSCDGADLSSSKVTEEPTSNAGYENSEHGMIASTIHLNIFTNSPSGKKELESSVENDMKKGDNPPEDSDRILISSPPANETVEDHPLKSEQSDQTKHSQLVEPIYNSKNELIGHRVVVDGDCVATPEPGRRTSPTTDLWDMVVRELVNENPEKFQPLKTDDSKSVESPIPQDVSVDDLDCGKKVSTENSDSTTLKGDNSSNVANEVDEMPLHVPDMSVKPIQDGDDTENQSEEMKGNSNDTSNLTDDKLPVKPTFNLSPIKKTPVKVNTEEEKRLEKEKTEILKGLGLARTPTGNEESPDFSSKSSPLKKYPLRHRRSNSGHSDDSPVKAELDWLCEQKLPIHEEIAQKIKAESLAKSIPGAKGPFKCPTCKRLYRTRESFKTHVKSCDFEVSTSDEEEEEEEEKVEEEEEETKDGRRRYSVREHTMEARKAMAGEMRARVELQNREASPSKKRGRPKRSLVDDPKDLISSNHVNSMSPDEGTPPVKRGRGRPKMSPDVVLLDHQETEKRHLLKNKTGLATRNLKEGVKSTPEISGIKGKRGRPPKFKSPVAIKSPTKEKLVSEKAIQEGIRKRGRPPLKSPKAESEEDDNGKTRVRRSPLKNLTPTKADIVGKRGRPSLKISPKKVFDEEDIVPRKRERLSVGGLKSPKLCRPVRGLVVSPRGRGRPQKTISVKIECKEETNKTKPSGKCSQEDDATTDSNKHQELNSQCGEVSPTRRRGRPAKISKSPRNIENVEESDGNVSVTSPDEKGNTGESGSTPDLTGDTSEPVLSPEIKRKRGRPFKNKKIQGKEPIKRDENDKPEVQVNDSTIGSEESKGDKSNNASSQEDSGTATRRKQHFIARQDKDSEADCEEFKGNNSSKENLSETSQEIDECSETLVREENSDCLKEGSCASSAIVIDSENEEDQEKEQQRTECEQNLSNDGQQSNNSDGKTPTASDKEQSLVENTESSDITEKLCSVEKDKKCEVLSQLDIMCKTSTAEQTESYSKKACITMVGAGFNIGKQEVTTPPLDNVTSTGPSEKTTSKVPTEEGGHVSSGMRRASSESNMRTTQNQNSSCAGISENMVHPTTPVSIRDLLQQKMAVSSTEKPGYQVVRIHRPKGADTWKEDIKSILPVLPANILEKLRDPAQRDGAVKMIQDLIKVKSATDTVKSLSQPVIETRNVQDIAPVPKFTLPSNLNSREAIQNYIKSHINQHTKEAGIDQSSVTSQHVTQEGLSGSQYRMVTPSISDPRLLSPAAMTTGFQVVTPTQNNLAGTIVQVPSNIPYHLSPPQPLQQLSPQIPMATHSSNQLTQLSPQVQVHTQPPRSSVAQLIQPTVNPQYLGEISHIPQLQNLHSSQLPPFNIAANTVSIPQQSFQPFNIAPSPQPVIGVTSTPTPIGQRAVLMGPPMGSYNIPHVAGMRPQEGVSSLPGTVMIPQQVPVTPQMYHSPQIAPNNSQLTPQLIRGSSASPQPSVITGEETQKKTPNTLVRIFVDGKPVAVTTDPSVLNNHDKLLSRLGSTNLQAGTYSVTVSTHKMSISTNTLTMAGQSSTSSPMSLIPKSTDNQMLHSLLKAPLPSSLGAAAYPTVTTSTQASNSSIMSTGKVSSVSNSAIKKLLSKREFTAVGNLHSYIKNTDGKVRKPMIKPNIIHKKRVTGNSNLSKKMLVTMEKNGMIQGALAKALMRKLVKNNNEMSPKKKIVFRGLTAPGETEKADSINISPVAETNKSRPPPTTAIKVKRATLPNKGKVNTIRKGIRRRKTPLKARSVALPHVTGVMSHPILHAQKDLLTLPQPAVEEEVVATPYSRANEGHGRGQSRDVARSKKESYLVFEISSDDGFSCRADSMDEVWRQIAEKVQDARVAARMKQLSFQNMDGATMFGVNHNSLRYLIEQLYGIQHFRNYETLYHHYDLSPEEEEPPENPTGCIRTEGYHGRKPFDMFSFLMSTYRRKPDPVLAGKSDVEMNLKSQRRATSMDLPMAMRFRKLKEHAREAVGVYRSSIHGRGLFCKRNIDGGEMIIEYAGEVIRSSLTDKREKYYESKGIGCYMFRIDDVDVVDATMRGSAARFINHSCEPNCYSKVIQVDGKKHIVIFASRAIKRSEELTYDYKFPIEEVKIPCTCGQKRCRKYLN
ncbi:uncharacterized protein LOC132553337 [Ylistrum balloti]|uniref:uncharacterized protein LOC132553337 n=1 Tax=Ylistrum balloti TaxID=509963 RepID=UPI002905BE69|nr:uncharacterized protein LOC132553337 [Ylistrum balloti]